MNDTIEQLLGDVRDMAEFSEERSLYLQDRLTLAETMLDFLPPHEGKGSTAAIVRVGPPHQALVLEEGTTTIGRKHAEPDDKTISRDHFVLELQGGEDGHVVLTDSSSRNGTWVNGNRVTTRTLCDGDLIEAGSTAFVFFRMQAAPPS